MLAPLISLPPTTRRPLTLTVEFWVGEALLTQLCTVVDPSFTDLKQPLAGIGWTAGGGVGVGVGTGAGSGGVGAGVG